MAGIGMITLGAILNATAFTGGSVLGQKFSGHGEEFLAEKERHDKAQERFQTDVERFNERRQKIYDWNKQRENDEFTGQRDLDMTDNDLQAYEEAAARPVFSNYFQPSHNQKKWELAYIGGGLVVGFLVVSVAAKKNR